MEGCSLFGGYLLCSECRYNNTEQCDVKRWDNED